MLQFGLCFPIVLHCCASSAILAVGVFILLGAVCVDSAIEEANRAYEARVEKESELKSYVDGKRKRAEDIRAKENELRAAEAELARAGAVDDAAGKERVQEISKELRAYTEWKEGLDEQKLTVRASL